MFSLFKIQENVAYRLAKKVWLAHSSESPIKGVTYFPTASYKLEVFIK